MITHERTLNIAAQAIEYENNRRWFAIEWPAMISSLSIRGEIGLGPDFFKGDPAVYQTRPAELVEEVGLTLKDKSLVIYGGDPRAFSVNCTLEESHLCLHTWPELKAFEYNLEVCNCYRDNSAKACRLTREIIELFGAPAYNLFEIRSVLR